MWKSSCKRAARCAALFVWAAAAVITVSVTAVPTVSAKMKTDRLVVEAANGAAPPRTIAIEVAETDEEKALGLMFRTQLGDDQGMLFAYGDIHEMTMWMRNTYISLDMVFINADGVIHRIEQSAEPLSDRVISSEGPVAAVLELAGGAAQRLGIKPGDRVVHALFQAAGGAAKAK